MGEGLQEPCPGETPAPGRWGRPGHRLVCGCVLSRNRTLEWSLASHRQLPAGWFCDVEPSGALGHQNLVATKDSVQEDQMRHKLGTKLPYKHHER